MTKTVVTETRRSRSEAGSTDVSAPKIYKREISPCAGQTAEEIAAYYRSAKVGAVAVVRKTQYHLVKYDVTEVEDTNPARGRTYIRGAGAFYMESGKNCFHPKGQTTLVVPTPQILAWADANPHGKFDVDYLGLSDVRPS